jgi:hypothetical protein
METILFIIIAGILSTLFGKSKGKSTGHTKPFTAKSFDDFRTKVHTQMENLPRKTGQISVGNPVKKDSSLQGMENKYQELKQHSVVSKMKSIPAESNPNQVETADILLEKPDEKTIINGIIWAEILGEPRAKKPYARKNY